MLYTAINGTADAGLLAGELTSAGLPVDPDGGVCGPDADGVVTVTTTRELTAPEVDELDRIVIEHDPAAARLNATRAEALPSLATRADVTGVQVRAVVDAICTLANDAFEALGMGRPLTADKILAYIATHPMAGDPLGAAQT